MEDSRASKPTSKRRARRANYGNATPEHVAEVILRYRPKKKPDSTPNSPR